MAIEVKVPQLPESVADATVLSWHKAPGDSVARDESLVELETDKVVLDVPAPASGVIREIRVPNGTVVKSGELLAVLEASVARPADVEPAKGAPGQEPPAPPVTPVPAPAAPRIGPAARRLLGESDLKPAEIRGSGREGRITKADVVAHLERATPAGAVPEAAQVDAPATAVPAGHRQERRVAMSRLRARIAQRMVEAQQSAAMLTTFNEADLSAVIGLRDRYKESFEKKYGIKLGFMSFFVKAAIEALRRFPVVNASVEGNDVVYHDYYDIGIAVSTERGLIVPVLRDAEAKSFAEVEGAVAEYGRKARDGSLAIQDLMGGTFTITNGGVFGSLLSTPILNPPQSGILGMHKIQERPVVVDGRVEVRPMMYLALTYDHRIIDGREAVQFVVAIKEALEDPGRLLLQV